MKQLLTRWWSLLTEIVFLCIGIYWWSTEGGVESILMIAIFSAGIIYFIINIKALEPQLDLIIKYNSGGKIPLRPSNKNPITEDGAIQMYGEGGIYVNEVYWEYDIIVRNNSSHPAFKTELYINQEFKSKVVNKNRVDLSKPLPPLSEEKLRFRYREIFEAKGQVASEYSSELFSPLLVGQLHVKLWYKAESGKAITSIYVLKDGRFIEAKLPNDVEFVKLS